MLSSMVSICAGGMTVRMSSSMRANRFSVSSMRVPGVPRTCSLMSPASTLGKKSRPTSGNRNSEAVTNDRKAVMARDRLASAQASQPP